MDGKEETPIQGVKKYFKWRLKLAIIVIIIIAIYVVIRLIF